MLDDNNSNSLSDNSRADDKIRADVETERFNTNSQSNYYYKNNNNYKHAPNMDANGNNDVFYSVVKKTHASNAANTSESTSMLKQLSNDTLSNAIERSATINHQMSNNINTNDNHNVVENSINCHLTNDNGQLLHSNAIGAHNGNGFHVNGILKSDKENIGQFISNNNTDSINRLDDNSNNLLERFDMQDRRSSSHLLGHSDPGDGLGPLPPKWETAYTERGELYFIDHNTGTSHWLDPRLSKFQKKLLEECSEDELPYGWEKIEDSLYGTYYIDHVNRKTQYENPVLEAKRRVAEQKLKYQNQQQTPPQQQQLSLMAQQRPPTPSRQNASNLGSQPLTNIPQKTNQPKHSNELDGRDKEKHLLPYKFTRNPNEILGERITTRLLKSVRGLGITIIGGDDDCEEFLQIKSIAPNSPAWMDGRLQMGDVLVYVNDVCVLGCSHHELVNMFQTIIPGETVTLEVCRGYPLPFDPNDPNTEVVTTIAVDSLRADKQEFKADAKYNFAHLNEDDKDSSKIRDANKLNLPADSTLDTSGFILMKKPETYRVSIVKGALGFGFTIADSALGQKVKKIVDRSYCSELQEGDIILQINDIPVKNKSHLDVVQILKDCSKSEPTVLQISRPLNNLDHGLSNVAKLRKNFLGATTNIRNNNLFRSKTPTADLYSSMQKEILPIRPKTPLVDTRRPRIKTPDNELNCNRDDLNTNSNISQVDGYTLAENDNHLGGDHISQNSLIEMQTSEGVSYMDTFPKMLSTLNERLASVTMQSDFVPQHSTNGSLRTTASGIANYESDYVSTGSGNYSSIYGMAHMPPTMTPLNGGLYGPQTSNIGLMPPMNNIYQHHDSCYCYDCQDQRSGCLSNNQGSQHFHSASRLPAINYSGYASIRNFQQPLTYPNSNLQTTHLQNERLRKRVNDLLNDRHRIASPLPDENRTCGSMDGYALHHNHYQQQQRPQHFFQHSQYPSGIHNKLQPNTSWQIGSGFNSLQPLSSDMTYTNPSEQYVLSEVTLQRRAMGFGFRIVGGTEEGSQVTVGHIVPDGAADNNHRINTGDEILSIDGINVFNASHHKVVSLMGEAALRGQVTMILRRRAANGAPLRLIPPAVHTQPQITGSDNIMGGSVSYPYDVVVNRNDEEGFGFVIISSSKQCYGSTIGKLIPGSPADRCGELKVGDRIIAVNNVDITGMSHGDVVNLIKESGLHVRLTIGYPREGALVTNTPALPATNTNLLLNSTQPSPNLIQRTLPNDADKDGKQKDCFDKSSLANSSNLGSTTDTQQQPSVANL